MRLGTFSPSNHRILRRYHGVAAKQGCPTFKNYAYGWLQEKELRTAESTYRTYEGIIRRHLIPYFGQMPIDTITNSVVEAWLRDVTKNIPRTYANDCLRRLKTIILDAEADHDFNARLSRVQRLRSHEPDDLKKRAIFTPGEASQLYLVSSPRLRTMILCCMLGGLRTGEVIALKREDVDFAMNRLHVRAIMSVGKRKSPKTSAGVRAIPMHPALRRNLEETLATHDDDFVFISERVRPFLNTQSFEREYLYAKEKAKVRDLRWYSFRKLFASIWFACADPVPNSIARRHGL
jgi:integrase